MVYGADDLGTELATPSVSGYLGLQREYGFTASPNLKMKIGNYSLLYSK